MIRKQAKDSYLSWEERVFIAVASWAALRFQNFWRNTADCNVIQSKISEWRYFNACLPLPFVPELTKCLRCWNVSFDDWVQCKMLESDVRFESLLFFVLCCSSQLTTHWALVAQRAFCFVKIYLKWKCSVGLGVMIAFISLVKVIEWD